MRHSPIHNVVDESYIVERLVDDRPASRRDFEGVITDPHELVLVAVVRYRIVISRCRLRDTPCGSRHLSRIAGIEWPHAAIGHCVERA